MKIDLENFKAIEKINDFEFKSINVLSGVNSGGKSSLIHFLLLLKQSVETRIKDKALILNGDYVSLGSYNDMIYKGKVLENKFEFKFSFSDNYIKTVLTNQLYSLLNKNFKKMTLNNLLILDFSINFKYYDKKKKIIVENYEFTYCFEDKKVYFKIFKGRKQNNNYTIETNYKKFFIGSKREETETDKMNTFDATIDFNSFILDELQFKKNSNYEDDHLGFMVSLPQNLLINYLVNISYISPLREKPHRYCFNDNDSIQDIGTKGENAVFILETKQNEVITYSTLEETIDGVNYSKKQGTLKEAVEYWLCDILKMSKKIITNNKEAYFTLDIVDFNGNKCPITHAGFGVSQILPIIVQGLLCKKNSTLILEQPEIHLHPKVQSLLFDFLYSLTLDGKKIIIETHSDHFITRMRRRIAEDFSNNIIDNVQIVFVENNKYKALNLREDGNLDYWHENFFDSKINDQRSIIKAQAKRAKNKLYGENQ